MNVSGWSGDDVVRWLSDQGLLEYCDSLRNHNGLALLNLKQSHFMVPPLSLVTSDGGQQLLERIESLRLENHIQAHKNGHIALNGFHESGPTAIKVDQEANGIIINGNAKQAQSPLRNGLLNGQVGNGFHHSGQYCDPKTDSKIPIPTSESPFPEEWGKTAAAFLYAMICFTLTTVMISVVHERVPSKEATPPLPDKFFDWFGRKEWAFTICEINGVVLIVLWLIQWALLKHRSIVGRRFFFIVGTLYLYRCLTMYITTLPVPGMHFKCSPKVLGDYASQMRRVLKMIAGGGLTITGSHHMCGDYLYSGHTVMLTLTYLFIREYSPKRFWWYHWLCWLLCAVGLFCILLAHDHYSIDVVVAYYITTRLFWWYHTMANQQALKEPSQSNFVSRVWWYRYFLYLETNVQGVIPRHYQLPFSFTWKRLVRGGPVKYSRLANSECP
ncbi:phosphatidylcholine:ceramide cholinephosphotransferase 1-like isoform X1 [Lampris incognitus]|uniref:phosphatidylcholine:ceramide cholinephosphotransferase 1-like isoform X1 n=1 Tax=Lampris incognitus TaxID=2546036 RepID=UPI0024B5CC03|nr:phosphatidylcholine:ceramide cholinephosphotransferase 1-like isoform X1 [Lampris incognitus]XP_056153232.1 phosphatidylcholine:ceramide cholinephosphotransferase 1-like isoform X1 [Lampris incognitus]